MSTDRVGKRLGNYTITQFLGRGGFAEVYLGEHIYLKSQAAVKVLQARLSGSEDMESFLKEAQTVARLSHPHIIRVMDFGIEEEIPYLVMDYAPKGTLRQKHPRGTTVPLPTIVSYVIQVAGALQYAHDELRLIHRDIKPENMLVGRRDEVLLSDFGIALVAQSSHYQRAQDVTGTVAYMAPEQIQGKPHAASDQYSLGVVVYEWLSGDRPFNGTFTETCTQHIFAPPPPLQEKVPWLPHDVDLVVMQALAKDPHHRFANIQAFATAFERVSLSGEKGEHTEQLAPNIHTQLTQAQTNIISNGLNSSPLNTPSTPLTGRSSDPQSMRSQQGQFLSPLVSTNLQDTVQTDTPDNSARPSSQAANGQPRQSAQPPVVLSSPPEYTPRGVQQPQFPPHPNNFQQQLSPPYPPRPQQSFTHPGETRPASQQLATGSSPYRPTKPAGPYHDTDSYPPDRTPARPSSDIQPAQHENEEADLQLGIFKHLLRPFIATSIGIILFSITNQPSFLMFHRPVSLALAILLFFGVAFGPIVGALVGLGGILIFILLHPASLPFPFNILVFPIDDFYSKLSAAFSHPSWYIPLIYGGIGFLAGLSTRGRKRYPGIGSVLSGTVLGAIGLFGTIGFTLMKLFWLSVLIQSSLTIGIVGGINIVIAFVVLVLYSIFGRLLDPKA